MRLLALTLWFVIVNVAHAYSLEDALRDALLHNNTIISVAKQTELASLKAKMSFSEFLPVASLGVAYDFNKDQWIPAKNGVPSNPGIGITITQDLSNLISPTSKLFLARREYLNTKFAYTDVLHKVMLQVVNAYLEVLRDEEILSLRKETVLSLKIHLDAVEKSLKLGESTKGELAYAKAKLLSAQSEYLQGKSKAENNRASLQYLVGKEKILTKLSEPTVHSKHLPKALQKNIELALINNSSLKAAKNAKESAKLRIVNSVSSWLPSVSIETTLQYMPSGEKISDGVKYGSTRTMIKVGLPLFTGGRDSLAVAMAYEDKALKEHEYHAKSKLLEQEVSEAWNNYKNSDLLIAASEEFVKASEIAASNIRQEALLSLKSNLNVIDTELELLQAKMQLKQAKGAKIGAFYKLFFMIYGSETLDLLLSETKWKK